MSNEHVPFDLEVLKKSRFYSLALELSWAIYMDMVYDGQLLSEKNNPKANQYIGDVSVCIIDLLCSLTSFSPRDVMMNLHDVTFERWMASPEGIAFNMAIDQNKGFDEAVLLARAAGNGN